MAQFVKTRLQFIEIPLTKIQPSFFQCSNANNMIKYNYHCSSLHLTLFVHLEVYLREVNS